jgi:hypothetical protein
MFPTKKRHNNYPPSSATISAQEFKKITVPGTSQVKKKVRLTSVFVLFKVNVKTLKMKLIP